MGEYSITALDVLIVGVILASAAFAAWRGLVSETFAIIDWVAAAFVALRVTPSFQPLLRETISPPWLEYLVVFAGIFLLIFIPMSILSHRFAEAVKKSEIGPVDRTLGFVFGIGRGIVLVGAAYIAFSSFMPPAQQPESLTHAQLFPVVRDTSKMLLELVPGEKVEEIKAQARATPPKTSTAPKNEKAASESNQAAKTYGANERSALDRLIETTGSK
jgi:membrane protein required for colicin V production